MKLSVDVKVFNEGEEWEDPIEIKNSEIGQGLTNLVGDLITSEINKSDLEFVLTYRNEMIHPKTRPGDPLIVTVFDYSGERSDTLLNIEKECDIRNLLDMEISCEETEGKYDEDGTHLRWLKKFREEIQPFLDRVDAL